MKSKNPAAVALGQMGKGVSRKFTVEEIAKRRLRLEAARAKRWPRKRTPTPRKKKEVK